MKYLQGIPELPKLEQDISTLFQLPPRASTDASHLGMHALWFELGVTRSPSV